MRQAIEAALKGTPVELVEIRLAESGLSGKGVSVAVALRTLPTLLLTITQ